MSRDSYKGVPKNRDARIAADGKLLPLNKTGRGSIDVSASVASDTLIFKPGSTFTGPVIFNNWNDLMSKLSEMRAASNDGGHYVVQIDDSITSPAVIPAAGSPHDMTNVVLSGTEGHVTVCEAEDGIVFTGLRHISNLFLTTLSVAPSPSPCTDFSSDGLQKIMIDNGATVNAGVGGVPIWDTAGADAGLYLTVAMSSRGVLAQNPSGGRPVIHIGESGQTVLFNMDGGSGVWRNGLSSVAGAIGFASLLTSSLWGLQQNWLGDMSERVSARGPAGEVRPVPTDPASTIPLNLSFADTISRYDVSGGGFTQVLPTLPQDSSVKGTCRRLMIKEESGNNGLLVGPAGSNTIEGSSSTVPVTASGSVTFIADGVSNWYIESIYNPSA